MSTEHSATARLARLLSLESLDDALVEGAGLLAEEAGVGAAAIFLADGSQPLRDFWHGSPEGRERHRPGFKSAALEAARTGARAQREASGETCPLRAFPLSVGEHVLGAICLPWEDGDDPEREGRIETLAAILAAKVHFHDEIARYQGQRSRDERWFKTLDSHLRLLDRERQKFAAFVGQTDTFVFVTNRDAKIGWANRAMCDLFPPEGGGSWIGSSCASVCARLGGPCAECPVARTSSEAVVSHQELRGKVGNAGEGLLYLTALPICGPNGTPDEIMVMIQDLTGLEGLRRSEMRYRLLYERNVDGILMVRPGTFGITLANPAACAILGFTPAEIQERVLADLHAPDEWDRLSATYDACLAGGSPIALECTLQTRFGEERTAQVAANRFRHEDEDVLLVSFRDVTEMRRAQRALERVEERLRAVIASAPIVLFAIDREGIFTVSEGHGLGVLGLKPGEVVGKSVYVLYKDYADVLEHVRRALAGDEIEASVDLGGIHFDVRYAPLKDGRGAIQGVIGVATDVTQRQNAEQALRDSEEALRVSEEQLRQAQKMEALGVLAGGVAHDFNNLLTVIMTQSELLRKDLPAGSKEKEKAESIHGASARGAMLTRQLLTFSRNEVLAPQVLDVNVVVGEIEGMLRRLIGEDIEITCSCDASPVHVRCDRGQIEQVIMNLAVNARDAMPHGGRLRIAVATSEVGEPEARELNLDRPGRYCVLRVEDTGAGMETKTLERIFEPFFTTKGPGKGTGLGLSTVYGVARQNGGGVSVRSEPGRGSTFTVHLPLKEPATQPAPPPIAPNLRARGGETVLLVEDEPGVRSIGKDLLEFHGYKVLEAENGVRALEVEARHKGPIHLLLTDVVMPLMGGRELAERLSTRRPETRILFVSGFTDDTVVRHGVLDEGVAFLQKPFTLESLSQTVRQVLDGQPVVPASPPSQAPKH
ncbi:MAG TPA: PAS domain-containing protein [Candidatus Eisenbacteria bacterium]|nr:PAS domain-containing protein [Candidatus Eisenbacteria bacterium]